MPLADITPFAVERWRSAYLKRKKYARHGEPRA